MLILKQVLSGLRQRTKGFLCNMPDPDDLASFPKFANATTTPVRAKMSINAEQQDNGASHDFLYFGYGSNMLESRLHLMNKTAKFQAVVKLHDYKLEFTMFSQRWQGCVATVTESPGAVTWGALYSLQKVDRENLDKQEGVKMGIYRPFEVNVQLLDGSMVKCLTYQNCFHPGNSSKPSPQYKDVIIRGAKEHNLPDHYIEFLESIETNGYDGEVSWTSNL